MLKPLELNGWNIGVGPVKITMVVVDSAGGVIRVENDEVQTVEVEGVIGQVGGDACVFDIGQELRFGNAVKVVVAKDVVDRTVEFLKFSFNRL